MTERSYNGWVASPDPSLIGVQALNLPDHPNACPPGVKAGDVATVLGYVVEQFHKRVEPLGVGCWGYAYRQNRNADNLSCHASGTAVDLNAPQHPNGATGTFDRAQVRAIHAILAETNHTIRWGGDFTGTRDEMHFEVAVSPALLHQAARQLATPKEGPRDMTDADVAAIAKAVRAAIQPDLLRLARYLRGQNNSVFNDGPAQLPEPKDCAS